MILEKGPADEIFILKAFSIQIDIAALIEHINSNPGRYKIQECETKRLLECNRSDRIDHEVLSKTSDSRLNQPLLVAVINGYEWVLDGSHRLLKRAELAKEYTLFIPIPGGQLDEFVSEFALRR